MITDSGVHTSLHSNCHHQTVFAKLHFVYPPPYLSEIWHYRKTNKRFVPPKTCHQRIYLGKSIFEQVNEKVDIFNKTILNILSDLFPHEIIVYNDKDPPWFNNRIKTLIQEKNTTYNIFRHHKDNPDLHIV